MPNYAYRAITKEGRQVRGHSTSGSEDELYQLLQKRGLDLIDCAPARPRFKQISLSKDITERDLIQFCMHLEHFSAAGVPLLDTLADIRDSASSARLRDIVGEMHRDVEAGQSLSAALSKHPKVFDQVFGGLIQVGEETGDLTDSFRHLIRHIKWQEAMAQRIKKAIRYPIFLTVVVLLVTFFLLAFVVPQMAEFLISMRQEPPFMTRLLLALSDGVRNYWYLVLLLPVVFYALVMLSRRLSQEMGTALDHLLLRIPVVGPLVLKIELARFSHMLAVMFRSGISILDAMEGANRLVKNLKLFGAVSMTRDRVRVGDPISTAMKASGLFPSIVVRMVKIGEDSGTLGDTLETVASFYDRDVDDSIDSAIGIIEPGLTVVLGLLMAWVFLAVFGPLYENLGNLPL